MHADVRNYHTISRDALANACDANDRLAVVCNLFDWLQSAFAESDTMEQSEQFQHYTGLDVCCLHTHTYTHTFNSPFSGTTRVGRYQKGKTNLDFTEARDSEWQ